MHVVTFLRDLGASFLKGANRSDHQAPARRLLLAGAAFGAACLMLKYVQVCHESVQRGDRWRAEQRALAGQVVVAPQPQVRP